jgi:hypothetical protein
VYEAARREGAVSIRARFMILVRPIASVKDAATERAGRAAQRRRALSASSKRRLCALRSIGRPRGSRG